MRGIRNSLGEGLLLPAAFTDSLHGCSGRKWVMCLARRVGHGWGRRGRRWRSPGLSLACPCWQRPPS